MTPAEAVALQSQRPRLPDGWQGNTRPQVVLGTPAPTLPRPAAERVSWKRVLAFLEAMADAHMLLPSPQATADHLGIDRKTLSSALAHLRSYGFVETEAGAKGWAVLLVERGVWVRGG